MRINVDRSTYSVYTGDDVMLSVSIFFMPELHTLHWIHSTTLIYSFYYHYTVLNLTSDRYEGGNLSYPSLVIRNVTVSDAGHYHLALTNVDGRITSTPIALNVDKCKNETYVIF